MLDVEFQFEEVGDIVEFVEEAREDFEILLWLSPRLVPGNLKLFLPQHACSEGDSLQCVCIVFV